METMRKPFQGIVNIFRFNWHLYVLSLLAVIIIWTLFLIFFKDQLPGIILSCFVLFSILVSVLVSYYVYDVSEFYALNWINTDNIAPGNILNIHAGFDETSLLLQMKFPLSTLIVYDFYDPLKHTEVSIKRARKTQPPHKGTIPIHTSRIPLNENTADHIFLIFAAHEIRSQSERVDFFKELNRVLKEDGTITIVEHLRDLPNILAYNIGSFHFLRRSDWNKTFKDGGFYIHRVKSINPFVKQFILKKNGTAH